MSVQTMHACNASKIDELAAFLKTAIPKSGWRINFTEWREHRTISQNALQHAIYADISRYLIARGKHECSPEWVKLMLKNKFLGWNDFEFVDVVTGTREIKQILRSTAALDVGEAQHYTEQIIAWSEGIGCHIKIPFKCEYRELMERQII